MAVQKDLKISIDRETSQPIYKQIAAQIKANVISGELKHGDPIPSVRSLAKHLNISFCTILKAYEYLQSDGFIESVKGLGSFICLNENVKLKEIEKLIVKARQETIKANEAEDKIHTLLDELSIDPYCVPTDAPLSDNLIEAISCYIQFGEYSPSELMQDIRGALK